jgi:cytochrome bd-type quinol oxidase subunit 2
MKKKFNYANLPILVIIIIVIIFGALVNVNTENPAEIALIGLPYLLILGTTALICPISLIFQIRNKDKTKLDKVLLFVNIVVCIAIFFIIKLLF